MGTWYLVGEVLLSWCSMRFTAESLVMLLASLRVRSMKSDPWRTVKWSLGWGSVEVLLGWQIWKDILAELQESSNVLVLLVMLLRFTFWASVHTGQTLEVVTEVVAFCESQIPEGAALRCEDCFCTVGELVYLYPTSAQVDASITLSKPKHFYLVIQQSQFAVWTTHSCLVRVSNGRRQRKAQVGHYIVPKEQVEQIWTVSSGDLWTFRTKKSKRRRWNPELVMGGMFCYTIWIWST